MFRTLADRLYNKNTAVKWLKNKCPEEEIIFASAATILETDDTVPIGWSIKRILQQRGVAIITRNQIALKNSVFSSTNLTYLFFLIYSLITMFIEKNWLFVIPVAFFGINIAQRWSYEKQISLRESVLKMVG